MHRKTISIIATTTALAFGVAACADDKESTSSSSSQSSAQSAIPKPVAQIDALSGRSTAVALDSGFVEALGTLKLTPAPVGDGKISEKGTASFPITGGNVTYYKPGSVNPYAAFIGVVASLPSSRPPPRARVHPEQHPA